MEIGSRTLHNEGYRYGFQGQEGDPEMKGQGNSVNYKYRMHDPRVGRFFAVDPLTSKYPHYSPFSFSGNKVIAFVELEGLEEAKFNRQIANRVAPKLGLTSDEFVKETNKATTVDAFKIPFANNTTAKNLIDHYAYGKGEAYELSKSEMLEVYPRVKPGGQPVNLSLTTLDFAGVGKLKEGESKPFKKLVLVYSGTSGTLGVNTVEIQGEIYLDPDTDKMMFKGTVIFKDTYDFNAADHRSNQAELQVTIARNFLPGKSFKVNGSLEVIQTFGGVLTTLDGQDPTKVEKPKEGAEHKDTTDELNEESN